MKILCIGNSFSQDATRYLRGVAHCDGEKLKVINLFIGGCSLWRHYKNALENNRAYQIFIDGEDIGFMTSIQEALLSDEWDIVTLQQASPSSYKKESYQPYLSFLKDYVHTYSPKSKVYIHQTWAYDVELAVEHGFDTHKKMYTAIKDAYAYANSEIKADGMIPSGELVYRLYEKGLKMHRDGFHVSLGIGRYALSLLWYGLLTGKAIENNTFADFDEAIEAEEQKIIKEYVIQLLVENTNVI